MKKTNGTLPNLSESGNSLEGGISILLSSIKIDIVLSL